MLSDQIKGIVSETNIDYSFPNWNFLIGVLSTPYRLDWNSSSGGLILFDREDIPSWLIEVVAKN